MANADAAFGLKPVQYLDGSPYNGQCRVYYVPSSDSTAIFKGDAVTLAGSADSSGMYPSVTQAAAGNTIAGVVVGFGNTPQLAADVTTLSRKYRPASTEMYVFLADDPNIVFACQEDSGGGDLAATSVGLNADVVVGSGSTVTGKSHMEIDTSDATTDSCQLTILGLADMDNNAIGSNANWLVKICEHQHTSTTGA